ncbi:non-ribosomal peptide synthase domain TIGR01720/amino acid adenylation domain-containing protein [Streptomyces sp. MnatMP-M77]|uniref:non-ribosomal peptide synthetase n=1 Tax=unclassified Streptomyces TaxID=2593676 RepID=UPI0008047DE3|nr:non-ribosomal peptide synthetase [Streptomyces sp. MnatMP-M77]MYT77483.1 non-ribosomal peptide synthetase [Streptomyces sp. SID8364]SBU99170.1 non-ribosomal peptide synthase domain TIGR01720/amino acid adenylation domain-containing protein [Streptomyces sp. MnatMP-M77]
MSEHAHARTTTGDFVAEAVDIKGPVDVALLQRAVRQVTGEAEAVRLRSSDDAPGGTGLTDGGAVPLDLVDLADALNPAAAREDWLSAATRAGRAASRSSQALLRLSDDRYTWFHLHPRRALDNWSCALIGRRTAEVYTALSAGTPPDEGELPGLALLTAAEDAYRASSAPAEDAAFWRDRLAGLTPTRSAGASTATNSSALVALPAADTERVRATARYCGTHPRAVLLAAVAAHLHQTTGTTDVVLGLPVDGRYERTLRRVPSAAEDIAALRLNVRPDAPFADLVRQVGRESRRARRHQRLRHAEVCRALGATEPGARLYRTIADVREAAPALWFGDHPATVRALGLQPSTAPRFLLEEASDGQTLLLVLGPESPGDGPDADARRLRTLLTAAVTAPGHTVASLTAARPGEPAAADAPALPATADPAERATLTSLLEAAARRTPDTVAVRDAHGELTYRELHGRANRLARLLVGRGAGPERLVGLLLPRSADTLVAMLAVLKSGAAYLPLDPAYPDERLRLMVKDAQPSCLLTDTAHAERDLGAPTSTAVVLDDPAVRTELASAASHDLTDDDRAAPLAPGHPAYVIYTSGSTGTPKGVVVAHHSVLPLLAWAEEKFGADALRQTLAATSFSFDVSVAEVFTPLVAGGTVEVVQNLLSLLDGDPPRWSGGLVCAIPSVLGKLLERTDLDLSARTLALGGETLPAALAERVAATMPDTRLMNVYGPTESTVYATVWHLDGPLDGAAPPIGRPLGHVRAHLLDATLAEVGPGGTGELYLAGDGLARGYLGRPALTAERFTADPFGPPGTRMYRTGDLVRRRDDGQLDFLGRVDEQIKVNGHRVEPGEVEAALTRHPEVAEAMAVVRADHVRDARLIAHLVPADPFAPPAPEELRGWLAALLPAHLVPAELRFTAALPRTPNGKLARETDPEPLAAPTERAPARRATTPEPTPAVLAVSATSVPSVASAAPAPDDVPLSREDLVAAAFAAVLRETDIPRDRSFFDLGGDSIMSIQLVSHLRQSGLLLIPQDIFEHKTVQALARVARETARRATDEDAAAVGDVPLTPIVHWLRDQGGPVDGFHQAVLLRVPGSLRADRLTTAVQALVDHHDAFRLRLDRSAPGWSLEVRPAGSVLAADCVRRVPAGGVSGDGLLRLLSEETARAQRELDVAEGRMIRVVWFDAGPDHPGRLLFMANHLACDGVSWRVVVPDLVGAYQDAEAGRASVLSPVETSLRHWSRSLSEQARTPERQAELPLWERMLDVSGPRFARRALDTARDTTGTARSRTVVYEAERARHLFTTIPLAFHCEINDVLLTALAVAVQRCLGTTGDVLIDIEGHGREPVVPGADLSRTIGWFTSMYPVRMAPGTAAAGTGAPFGTALGDALRRVKEQLRAIPDKGIGFGMLRHLGPDEGRRRLAAAEPRDIGFNYFGRFLLPSEGGEEDWSPAPETGMTAGADADMPLDHPLSVNALTEDTPEGTALRIAFSWADGAVDDDRVDELIGHWFEALDALAAHAAEPGAGGRTPSDFPLVSLGQREIELLEHEHPGLDEILPLSSLQQGMLYHLLLGSLNSSEDGGAEDSAHALYTVQFWLELAGDLDTGALRQAFRILLDRHRNLGAAFVHTGLPQPVQVLRPGVDVPWRERDLSALPESEQEREMERLLVQERSRPYDPARAPLLRVLLADLGGGSRRLVLSMHHILLDGWSLPVVVEELFAHYRAEVTGTPHALPAGTPFREYMRWLSHVDVKAAEDAWHTALDGFTPTRIGDRDPGEPLPSRQLRFSLGEEATGALTGTARRYGLTLATVLQSCWALVLGEETGHPDIVFGSVVSGRPAELPGVEKMVGLFINTVPTRVRIDPAESLGDLFARIQDEQARLLPYQHISLTDIRRITDSGDMFDTMMSFANYPFDGEALRHPAPGLELVRASGDDRQHYPLGVVISHRDDLLTVQVEYRPHLINPDRAEDLVRRFVALLHRSAQAPHSTVGALDTAALLGADAYAPAAEKPAPDPSALDGGTGVLLPLREEGSRPPLFCVHPAAGIAWSYAGLTGPLGTDQPLYGLQARGLDGSRVLPGSIAEMATDYVTQIRTVQPTGPYHLLGWSFGGVVAHEMAVQLQRMGEEVGLLAVLDSMPLATPADDGPAPDTSAVGEGDGGADAAALRFGPDHVMRTVLQFFGYDPALWADEEMTYPRFLEIARAYPGLLATFDEAMIETICRVYTNNAVLSHDHAPSRYTGDLLVFTALETSPEAATRQWEPYVDGGKPEGRPVDCPHAEMGRPGPLAEIAETLVLLLRGERTGSDTSQ